MSIPRPRAACIVGHFGDAEISASGARVESLAEGLAGHGYDVATVGVTSTSSEAFPSGASGVAIQKRTTDFGDSLLIVVRSDGDDSAAKRIKARLRHVKALKAFTYRALLWGRQNRGGVFLLYGHRGELLVLGVLAARISRCRTVIDITEWYDRASRASLIKWVSALVAQQIVPRLVDCATVISSDVITNLPELASTIELPAMAPRRVTEWDGWASRKNNRASSNGTFVCVFTGRERRGLIVLVRALEDVALAHPRVQFVLKISGSDHSLDSLTPVRLLSLEHVGVLAKEDYLALLTEADCLVIPGSAGTIKDYAFPNRLPEYLLSGAPTIVSGYPAVARMMVHGEHAILLPTDDAVELRQAIESVLLNPDEMQRMGQRGRSHALAAFDPVRLTAPLAAVIRQAKS